MLPGIRFLFAAIALIIYAVALWQRARKVALTPPSR